MTDRPVNKPPSAPLGWLSAVKKGVKWFFVSLFLLPALLVAAIVLMQLAPVKSYIKNVLVSVIEGHLNATVEIGEIRGNFIRGVTIEKFKLSKDADTLISFDKVSADYALPLLIRRIVFIHTLDISGLRVNLVQGADGTWNLAQLVASEEDSPAPEDSKLPAFQVAIKRLTIDDSQLSMVDHRAAKPEKQQVDITRCALNVHYGRQIDLDLTESLVSLSHPNFQNVALQGSASFEPDGALLKIASLGLQTHVSDLSLSGNISFEGKTPAFDLTLFCEPLSLAEIEDKFSLHSGFRENVVGSLAVKGDTAHLTFRTKIDYQKATLHADGAIKLDALPAIDLSVEGRVRSFNPATLPFESMRPFVGDLNTDFDLRVTPAENSAIGEGRLALSVLPSDIQSIRCSKGALDLAFSKRDFHLQNISLLTAVGELHGKGLFSNFMGDDSEKKAVLTISLKALKPHLLPSLQQAGFSGTLNIDIQAHAGVSANSNYSTGELTVKATPHDSTMTLGGKPLPLDAFHAIGVTAAWKDSRITVASSHLDTDFGRVTMAGEVEIQREVGKVTAEADLIDLRRFSAVFSPLLPVLPADPDLSGRATINVTMAGAFVSPTITCRINGTDIGAMAVSAKHVEARGEWRGPFSGRDATAVAKLTGVEGKGNRFHAIDATATLKNDTAGFSVGMLHEAGHQVDMAGKIELPKDNATEMTIDHLAVQTKGLAAFDTLKNKGPIRLKWHYGTLEVVSCRVAAEPANIDLSGTITDQGDQDMRLSIEALDLRRFSWLWGEARRVTGVASVQAKVQGRADMPILQGDIHIRDFSGKDLPPADLKATVTYGNGKGHIAATLAQNQKNLLSVNGGMAFPLSFVPFNIDFSKSHADFSIQAKELKLSELPLPKSKEISLDGALTIDLSVAGAIQAPTVTGDISLSNGRLMLIKSGLTYEQVGAEILLKKDAVHVQKIFLKGDKEGYVQGVGRIGLKEGMPSKLDMTVTGEKFFIPYQKSIYVRISPHLVLSGLIDAPVLTGEVQIVESRINLDRMAPESPPEIEIVNAPSGDAGGHRIVGEAAPSNLLNRLTAEVVVKAPGSIWLKGQDINMEVGGDVALKKKSDKPFTLLGELHAIRGSYYFRGRQFKIEKGTVNFIGLETPNPAIDIKATAKVQTAVIIILVSGTARELVLRLDSDPKMDPSDIISYLVFGKPTDALKGGQAFNAEKAALSLSGGLLASELRTILGDVFFIDSFALETGDDAGAGSVSFGKYVRPNIYIMYRRGFGEEGRNRVEISYEYNPNIRIETQLGDDKNNGVDVFWEFDF